MFYLLFIAQPCSFFMKSFKFFTYAATALISMSSAFISQDTWASAKDEQNDTRLTDPYELMPMMGGLRFGSLGSGITPSQDYQSLRAGFDDLNDHETYVAYTEALFVAIEKDAPLEGYCNDFTSLQKSFDEDAARLCTALTRHLNKEGARTGLRALGLSSAVWGYVVKNEAFMEAFDRNPVSEITFFGSNFLPEFKALKGATHLHVLCTSSHPISGIHMDVINASPNLSVLSFKGSVRFRDEDYHQFTDYIARSKTLLALEIADVNKHVYNGMHIVPRNAFFPNAPQSVSNYFFGREFTDLFSAILQK